MTDADTTAFFAKVMPFIERVLKLKGVMLKRGLSFSKTTCTIGGCEGELHVRLDSGRKRHARAWCTKCDLTMME